MEVSEQTKGGFKLFKDTSRPLRTSIFPHWKICEAGDSNQCMIWKWQCRPPWGDIQHRGTQEVFRSGWSGLKTCCSSWGILWKSVTYVATDLYHELSSISATLFADIINIVLKMSHSVFSGSEASHGNLARKAQLCWNLCDTWCCYLTWYKFYFALKTCFWFTGWVQELNDYTLYMARGRDRQQLA